MPTLLMCPNGSDLESLQRFHRVPEGSLLDRWGREPRSLSACEPYLLGSDHGQDESGLCNRLAPHGRLLCDMCQDFGGPATVELAEISFDLRNHAASVLDYGGAAAGVYGERIGRFSTAMEQHQKAIAAYHGATRRGAPKGVSKALAREQLLRSGAELNASFRHELGLVSRKWYPRSTMLVSGGQRVPDRVRHSRKISRLDVASQAQASRLVELGRYARYGNRGLLGIDLGRRVLNVHATHEDGGDWHRQAFVETVGFSAGAWSAGVLTASAVAALNLVVVATPVGWVLLVVAGLAAAGVVMAGSATFSQSFESAAGQLYDLALTVHGR